MVDVFTSFVCMPNLPEQEPCGVGGTTYSRLPVPCTGYLNMTFIPFISVSFSRRL